MRPTKFSMIAANTSRTRAYLAALERHRLIPECILILDSSSVDEISPGQTTFKEESIQLDEQWPEASFDPQEPLLEICGRVGACYAEAGTRDINLIRSTLSVGIFEISSFT